MKLLAPIALWVFWISVGMVAYAYFVYPAVLFVMYATAQILSDVRYLLTRQNRRAGSSRGDLPGVTFLVPAYNEEAHLPEKIENLRQTGYPREKLQIVFVSDGSTDLTNEILSRVQDPRSRGGDPAATPRQTFGIKCRRSPELGTIYLSFPMRAHLLPQTQSKSSLATSRIRASEVFVEH